MEATKRTSAEHLCRSQPRRTEIMLARLASLLRKLVRRPARALCHNRVLVAGEFF